MYRSTLVIILLLQSLFLSGQNDFYNRLADSALTLTKQIVKYDPAYYSIKYPNGDVPPDRGVCTDVIIRLYRMFDIDLQELVHEDMKGNFIRYPDNWGLSSTDRNIDHRRVPNLMVFFERHGEIKSITDDPGSYLPGDIVCWDLGGGITHIGIVVHPVSDDEGRHLIVHNIGGGQVLADCLFSFRIIGHYRFRR